MIRYALATEKSIRLMESENKLIFLVDNQDKKADIKASVEKDFSVKVDKVNVLIGKDGKKRAYIKFNIDTPAIDVATKLGLI